jgi:hypothetical protein
MLLRLSLAVLSCDQIEELVSSVSSQEQQAFLEVLTGIHSRLSTASTATQVLRLFVIEPTRPIATTVMAECMQASYYITGMLQGMGLRPYFYFFAKDYAPNVMVDLTGDVRTSDFIRSAGFSHEAGELEPEKVVVIGAHYDDRTQNKTDPTARAPGANDDGSGTRHAFAAVPCLESADPALGTAAAMELVRVFASSGARLRYTLRVCFFAGTHGPPLSPW